ncbi:MAG TPA: hypothetical protein PKO06_21370, partial [Candidatus Ozemobacteraceae bacterium]|nr:hypothetical protein [Candidatus Ozemobacteraceae bacterium]
MSDSARFRLMIALFLIMIGSSAVFMYLQQSAIQAVIDDASDAAPNEERAREEADKIEKQWQAATAAMKARDYRKAREHLGQAAPFDYQVNQLRETELRPSLPFSTWWRQQTAAFSKATRSEFAQVARDALAKPAQSHQFVD